ncbi:MAG: class I SAM-dependent methyltransferase [Myxococcales bacterium]|nr:class I SAM-dependent methyltransferase [Myxococcales bacterium]MDD9971154.1 class I SAM-dependent methyltransferase [Myxococcales bacterium]
MRLEPESGRARVDGPNYGNWIRVRIILIFLAAGSGLLVSSLLVPDGLVRVLLLVSAAGALSGFLYFTYLYRKLSLGLQEQLWELVLEHLCWNGQGRALDIGTGNGPLAIKLAQDWPRSQVDGIDSWGFGWEYAQQECERNAALLGIGDRVRFTEASASRLPFEEGVFDAVVSHFVFHEVADAPDKRRLIQEGLRVLRKGGAFAFQDMFLEPSLYGEVEELLETVRSWGVRDVKFARTGQLVRIPPLLRHRRVLGSAGILYGYK